MKWKTMSSPTPSVDSSSGAPTLCSFADQQGDLGLGLELPNGCHGSSSSSSTCSSIIFPHLSFSNGVLSNGFTNGSDFKQQINGDINGLPSPTGNGTQKCGLCHETFNRPKVLSCLHTFCQDCMDKAQDAGGDYRNVKEVVGNGNNNNNNNNININTSSSGEKVSCTQHKGELLQFYCRTCAVPVCSECVATEHPKSLHECEVLSECEAKYVKHLSQYINEFRVKSMDLHDVLKSFEMASSRLQTQYVKAQNEVSEAFVFYRNLLDERKSELMKELESIYSTRQVTLSVVTQRVQETLDKMYQTVEFGDRLLRHAAPPQVLIFKKLLETRLQTLLAAVPELEGMEKLQMYWGLPSTIQQSNAPTLAMASAAAGDLEFVANYSAMQASVRNTLGYIRSVGPENISKPPAPIARPPPSQNGYHNNHNNNNGNGNGNNSNTVSSTNTSTASLANGSSSNGNGSNSTVNSLESSILSKRLTNNGTPTPYSQLDLGGLSTYEKWSNADASYQNGPSKEFSNNNTGVNEFISSTISLQNNDPLLELTSKLMTPLGFPKTPAIKRQKMIYHCKFGEFGTAEAQFTEPSGVAVNANNEIIVADTNNHRIQIFDREGRFKFQFGECGKRDGQLLYPNRVAVVKPSGDIVVTERSPTHQIQIYNQYGQFVRKFGANILQHPRGVTVDNKGRIIVVECKVMRVIIFDQMGIVLHKFGCSKHLEFPNGVVVNDKQEIFISDNRAHCVKVFNYEGVFLRQIGGEGLTNYPIGVGINSNGEILVADNHNNFNLTIFTQEGQLVSALESKVKHAQCFDVALMDDGSVVLASKDYRLYIYRYIQIPPIGM